MVPPAFTTLRKRSGELGTLFRREGNTLLVNDKVNPTVTVTFSSAALAPDSVGDVVRRTEENLALVECFSKGGGVGCRIDGTCRLKGALAEALEAFLGVLDGFTLEDVVKGRSAPLLKRLTLA